MGRIPVGATLDVRDENHDLAERSVHGKKIGEGERERQRD
jgi:hypothetical protein